MQPIVKNVALVDANKCNFIAPLVKRSLIYELISCITGLLDTVDGVLNHALSLIFYEIVIYVSST